MGVKEEELLKEFLSSDGFGLALKLEDNMVRFVLGCVL